MEECRSWRSRQRPALAKRNCGARFALRCRNSRRFKVFPQSADATKKKRSLLSEALVDPRIYAAPTEPDFAPDSSNGDEGVDYLRPLKGALSEALAWGGVEARAAVAGE